MTVTVALYESPIPSFVETESSQYAGLYLTVRYSPCFSARSLLYIGVGAGGSTVPLLVVSVVEVVPVGSLVMPVVSPLPEVVAEVEDEPVVYSGLFPQATMPMHMEIASIKANIRIGFFIFPSEMYLHTADFFMI